MKGLLHKLWRPVPNEVQLGQSIQAGSFHGGRSALSSGLTTEVEAQLSVHQPRFADQFCSLSVLAWQLLFCPKTSVS